MWGSQSWLRRTFPGPALALSSSINVAAVADAMDDDSVSSLVEKYAVIAGAKPRQSFFTRLLIGLMAANLVHGEAEIGDGLLKGNALAALPEVLTRGRGGAAVLFGQFVVLSVNHHLEQLHTAAIWPGPSAGRATDGHAVCRSPLGLLAFSLAGRTGSYRIHGQYQGCVMGD